jgi:hypothetical protein
VPKLFSFYSEELMFKFSIDREAGADEASWLETEDHPPLPPRMAIETSKRVQLELLADHSWAEPQFHSCALKRTSKYEGGWWYYEVEWMVWPPEQDGSDRGGRSVPVMLNGKVPPSEVFKYEDRDSAWKT